MTSFQITELDDAQIQDIDNRLGEYDKAFTGDEPQGEIKIGVIIDGQVVAGAWAEMTEYSMFYLSTLFVDEQYRHSGIGTTLVTELTKRAREMGANAIRVDTFGWQAAEFYPKAGFTEVGHYTHPTKGFTEHFFFKSL